ncbi:MAG: hypothetical protein H6622_07440 [Halobacteriovoraceae bacterium]|nr:hypothetical protein [Halobacteriovoraceae bacterium]
MKIFGNQNGLIQDKLKRQNKNEQLAQEKAEKPEISVYSSHRKPQTDTQIRNRIAQMQQDQAAKVELSEAAKLKKVQDESIREVDNNKVEVPKIVNAQGEAIKSDIGLNDPSDSTTYSKIKDVIRLNRPGANVFDEKTRQVLEEIISNNNQ